MARTKATMLHVATNTTELLGSVPPELSVINWSARQAIVLENLSPFLPDGASIPRTAPGGCVRVRGSEKRRMRG